MQEGQRAEGRRQRPGDRRQEEAYWSDDKHVSGDNGDKPGNHGDKPGIHGDVSTIRCEIATAPRFPRASLTTIWLSVMQGRAEARRARIRCDIATKGTTEGGGPMRGAERPLFSSFQGENLGCFLPLPGEPGPLIRPRGPHLGEETAGRALGKWRKQGSVQPARTGVRSGIRSPYQAGPSVVRIRAGHCGLSIYDLIA